MKKKKQKIKPLIKYRIRYVLSDNSNFIDIETEVETIADAYQIGLEEYNKKFNETYGFFEQIHVSNYKLIIDDIT